MADDKRDRGDQPQGGDQDRDRQRQKDRKPGGGGTDSPDSSNRTRKDDEPAQE